ncbi:hypothetical protein ID866_10743, partial [Astraeus odoratus]
MQSRYELQAALGDLEEAISFHKQALDLCPASHPSRSLLLNNLASCMHSRYESQGAFGDLEEAIFLNKQALDLRPIGHPNRSSSLINLANCMQSRYLSQGTLQHLQEAISFHQQALDLCPVGHENRSSSLVNLANCMQLRYESQSKSEDLEEAICLNQQALDSCPVGHPNRPSSLASLAICMQAKYKLQGELGDLEHAISLHQQALSLCPDGHQNRSSSLGNLAISMQTRYESQRELRDLEGAISLYQQALDLFPVGHPNRPSSLGNLGISVQTHYQSQGALGDLEETVSLFNQSLDLCQPGSTMWESIARRLSSSLGDQFNASPTIPSSLQSTILADTQQLIKISIQDFLHDVPPRLLHTNSGTLLTQAQMITHFYDSQECQKLVTFLDENNDWNAKINHVQETISAYFQYATLSHRWGLNEPSLQHIINNGSIYEMLPTIGLLKLQQFCHTAAHHGYSWAWSDTCCIDKKNSVELQKAIGSMFLCEWLARGWTLQELLAPNIILFYTQDWRPYMNSKAQNHKQDVHILNELKNATGIPPHYLSNFTAGMDNARLRLQWAAGRHTTVPEDIAYSLFGAFNLHLPVLYGEGQEKSLLRLLQEILSQSQDISILHWFGEQSSRHSCFPVNISSYQSLPHVQPDLTILAINHSVSRLQQLISSDDAHRVYNDFANLPSVKFIDYILTLPCIVHHVQVVKLRQTYMNCQTYDVQAVGLRPVQIITPEYLMESMEPTNLPYVLIRVWDRHLVNVLEEDHVMAGYKVLMELEKPFIALMLLRLPEGEYRRI